MIKHAIIDTGPLVAFLDRRESRHEWSIEHVQQLEQPLLVCEAVLTETMFLLKRLPAAQHVLLKLLRKGALSINFALSENVGEVEALMRKYSDKPMSLADACIVRMFELNSKHLVFTLDSDFRIYRAHGRSPIKILSPKNEKDAD